MLSIKIFLEVYKLVGYPYYQPYHELLTSPFKVIHWETGEELYPTILKSFFNDPMSIVWFYFFAKPSISKWVAEGFKISIRKGKIEKNKNFFASNILLLINNNMYDKNSFYITFLL